MNLIQQIKSWSCCNLYDVGKPCTCKKDVDKLIIFLQEHYKYINFCYSSNMGLELDCITNFERKLKEISGL